ncbi:MAG: type II CAAX endopeptidase family protein [Terracidiphilus sp.]
MSNFAEDEPLNAGADEQPQHSIEETISEDAIAYTITGPFDAAPAEAAVAELPMFHSVMEPEPEPVRIPHLGHFLLMLVLLIAGFIGAILVMLIALHFHLYGVSTLEATKTEIHYQLGSEGLGYLFTLGLCMLVFPLLWHKSFFAGVQWNGATAIRLRWRLVGAAIACLLLALLNSVVLPGPSHAPIEDIFRERDAAWLLFIFGSTFAPFFEEMFFRGFLLPALCTSYDWCAEKIYKTTRLPLGENGHPQWSLPAMAIAAVVTSIPFAGMHAAQTGYSVGPFLLLLGVSIVLCTVRLWTRSLASSTLVHASYNFMLFSIMLITSHGFRHLDKM